MFVAWLNPSCVFLTNSSVHSYKGGDSVPLNRWISQGSVREGGVRTEDLDLFDFGTPVFLLLRAARDLEEPERLSLRREHCPLHQDKERQCTMVTMTRLASRSGSDSPLAELLPQHRPLEAPVLWKCVKVYLFPVHLAAGPNDSRFSTV